MITTQLPPPTAAAFISTGRWPHMPALRTELRALVADLDPETIPRTKLDPEVAQTLCDAGWCRVIVGVYAPIARDEVFLGWYPPETYRDVVGRVLAHLPGARLPDERLYEGSVMIEWGSRTPGWTPTALLVRRSMTVAWREPDAVWDAAQCAAHCGITASTWRSYVSRRDAGIPIPLGDARLPGRHGAITVWDRQAVIDWNGDRPGRGGRPPRAL